MKKKILIFVIIVLVVCAIVFGTLYKVDMNRMNNNKPVLFSTWGYDYCPPVEMKISVATDKAFEITNSNGINGEEDLNKFIENVQNEVTDSLAITQYTIEGDKIITTVNYLKETEQFEIIKDNRADRFSRQEDRNITTTEYSAELYDFVKEENGDYIEIKLKENVRAESMTGDVFICRYSKENEQSYSFFATVIESNAKSILVEPVEGSSELNSSDKISVGLGEHNDALYMVGTVVKITYDGLIEETYPAQIHASKIEIKSVDNFEVKFYQRKDLGIKTVIEEGDDYAYNVKTYGGDVKIKIDDKEYDLEEAIINKKITVEEIIKKANLDTANGVANMMQANDGGSAIYKYDDYTIIKYHTLDGNRDVYFGIPSMNLEVCKK